MKTLFRYFLIFMAIIMLLSSCEKENDETSDRNKKAVPIVSETDWTAGIVSDSTKLPLNTFSIIRAVRSASHEEYDRIVFEFSDPGIANYHLEYVDEPVHACGSGKVVDLPGDGWLEIRFRSARMHDEGTSTIEERDRKLDLPIILRLVSTCDFENMVTWVAAVFAPNKYRVMELNDPPRLVVDITH